MLKGAGSAVTNSLRLVAVLAYIAIPSLGFGTGRDIPPVINQSYDDDCGVAALRMLLQRGGTDVTEAELLAGLPASSGVDALSASDLKIMVASLDQGVKLEIGFIPVDSAASFARKRPFIVLLEPRGIGGELRFDHYVVIEGRFQDRFLAADPLLSERVTISDDVFDEYTRGKTVDGRPLVMVLKLVTANGGEPVLIPALPESTRLRTWKQSYELPRLLPVGKAQVSLNYGWQRERAGDKSLLLIESEGSKAVLDVTVGIRPRTQVGVSLTRNTATNRLDLASERFSVREDDVYGIGLHVDHLPDIDLPPSLGLATSASISWDGRLNGSAGVHASWNRENVTAGLGLELFHDSDVSVIATPSIRYRFPDIQGAVPSVTFLTPFLVEQRDADYLLQASIGRQFSEDLHLALYAGTKLFDEESLENFQVGIKLTYGIPRRFRP